MAELYNDGTVQYGTRDLAITLANGDAFGTYLCDNFTLNRPAKIIRKTNNLDEPSGSVGVLDFVEGSATLQFADGNAKAVTPGLKFTETVDATISAETFYITSAGVVESKDGEKKQNISFIKKYGA